MLNTLNLVRRISTRGSTMELKNVVSRLQAMAPTSLAGSWDNVGLLVEPSPPHEVRKVLLTNDLTPPVLQEAIKRKSDMIISYHPPIFSALKRLTQKKWKEEIVVKCIENRIAVYSPHTSYDCVQGGVNDWLISCFDCVKVQPVESHSEYQNHFTHRISFSVCETRQGDVISFLKSQESLAVVDNRDLGNGQRYIECLGNMQAVSVLLQSTFDVQNLAVVALAKVPKPGYGMGRKGQLKSQLSVGAAVDLVKKHLKLDHVRLAKTPEMSMISSVAVCAGSGSSVLCDVQADLYVTGEMSHHDVLHAVYNRSAVILCEHSNTERGFLSVLQTQIKDGLENEVEIEISTVDSDPLVVV